MKFRFDCFEIDTERFELRNQGSLCAVEPMVFDLLVHFATHPQVVFSRDELIHSVWSGRLVSDSTVATCIKSARKALGDSGEAQHFIKTVRGRGYSFHAAVTSESGQTDKASAEPLSEPTPATAPTANSPASADPALLVLPFRLLSQSDVTQLLAHGLVLELGAVLTRVPLLRLVTRPGAHDPREIAPSPRHFHEQLGVNYVLDGSVQDLDDNCRITVQLCDASSGFSLWAERFVIASAPESALQDAVQAIIAKLEPQLHRAIHDAVRNAQGTPTSRTLFLEASSVLALKGWHHDSFGEAARLLRESLSLDPQFAHAAAFLALVTGLGQRIGLMVDPAAAKAEALEAAQQALALDSMNSTVLGYSACALADIGQVERGASLARNAVEINPANAQAWATLGSICLMQRDFSQAVTHLSHGINISPLDGRLSFWGAMLALALLLSNDSERAEQEAVLACQRDDSCYLPRVVLAAVRLQRREPERMLAALRDAWRIKPDLSATQIHPLVGKAIGDQLLSHQTSAGTNR